MPFSDIPCRVPQFTNVPQKNLEKRTDTETRQCTVILYDKLGQQGNGEHTQGNKPVSRWVGDKANTESKLKTEDFFHNGSCVAMCG